MSSKMLLKRKEELRSQGFSILLYRPDSVTLRKRPSTNIWLAILLTSVTGGLWLVFWAVKYFRETEIVVLKENKDGTVEESYQIGKVSVYGTPEKHEAPKIKTPLAVPIVISAILGAVIISGIVNSVQTATREAMEAERLQQEILNDWTHPLNLPSLNSSVVPWLVGKDATLVVEAFFDKFDFYLTEVNNLDTVETISQPIASYNSEDEYYSGYFVCGQSLPPGSNYEGWKESYDFSIAISTNCARNQPEFVMGEAATLAGRWMPLPVAGASAISEVKTIDGVFVQFIDEEYGSPKRMLIQTGFGYSEVELAWIDIASDWCRAEDPDARFEQEAIKARDALFAPNQNIRLVQPEGLAGSDWFVHRLSAAGVPLDGALPNSSTNELLVASGYWVPDESNVSQKSRNLSQNIADRNWKPRYAKTLSTDLLEYAGLLAKAANEAKENPNEYLATCFEKLQEDVDLYNTELAAARDEDDDRRNYVRVSKKKKAEKSKAKETKSKSGKSKQLTASDCEGDTYYANAKECDGGDRIYAEYLGIDVEKYRAGSSGRNSQYSGGGSNCTWVNGYTRSDGTRVRGHSRCR